jgi:hypothetical protein
MPTDADPGAALPISEATLVRPWRFGNDRCAENRWEY